MKPGNAIMIAFGKGGSKGPPKPGAKEESKPEMEGDEEEGEVSEEAVGAASEFADAIKSGDAKLIAMAFKNLSKEC